MRARYADLAGKRFGRLSVISYAGSVGAGAATWRCRCDCGSDHTARADSLKRGSTTSCGCKHIENNRSCRTKHPPLLERFFKYVFPVTESGCWLWVGSINRFGYGRFTVNHKPKCAHRISYEIFVGPIPEGMGIDHLCRVRGCVNPRHLEPVIQKENNLRAPTCISTINLLKTHCKYGHEFTPDNTIIKIDGNRGCRQCGMDRGKRRYARIKAERGATQ